MDEPSSAAPQFQVTVKLRPAGNKPNASGTQSDANPSSQEHCATSSSNTFRVQQSASSSSTSSPATSRYSSPSPLYGPSDLFSQALSARNTHSPPRPAFTPPDTSHSHQTSGRARPSTCAESPKRIHSTSALAASHAASPSPTSSADSTSQRNEHTNKPASVNQQRRLSSARTHQSPCDAMPSSPTFPSLRRSLHADSTSSSSSTRIRPQHATSSSSSSSSPSSSPSSSFSFSPSSSSSSSSSRSHTSDSSLSISAPIPPSAASPIPARVSASIIPTSRTPATTYLRSLLTPCLASPQFSGELFAQADAAFSEHIFPKLILEGRESVSMWLADHRQDACGKNMGSASQAAIDEKGRVRGNQDAEHCQEASAESCCGLVDSMLWHPLRERVLHSLWRTVFGQSEWGTCEGEEVEEEEEGEEVGEYEEDGSVCGGQREENPHTTEQSPSSKAHTEESGTESEAQTQNNEDKQQQKSDCTPIASSSSPTIPTSPTATLFGPLSSHALLSIASSASSARVLAGFALRHRTDPSTCVLQDTFLRFIMYMARRHMPEPNHFQRVVWTRDDIQSDSCQMSPGKQYASVEHALLRSANQHTAASWPLPLQSPLTASLLFTLQHRIFLHAVLSHPFFESAALSTHAYPSPVNVRVPDMDNYASASVKFPVNNTAARVVCVGLSDMLFCTASAFCAALHDRVCARMSVAVSRGECVLPGPHAKPEEKREGEQRGEEEEEEEEGVVDDAEEAESEGREQDRGMDSQRMEATASGSVSPGRTRSVRHKRTRVRREGRGRVSPAIAALLSTMFPGPRKTQLITDPTPHYPYPSPSSHTLTTSRALNTSPLSTNQNAPPIASAPLPLPPSRARAASPREPMSSEHVPQQSYVHPALSPRAPLSARWRPDMPSSSPQPSSALSTQPVSLTPRVLPIKLVSELDSPAPPLPLSFNSMTKHGDSLSQTDSSSNNTTSIINAMDTTSSSSISINANPTLSPSPPISARRNSPRARASPRARPDRKAGSQTTEKLCAAVSVEQKPLSPSSSSLGSPWRSNDDDNDYSDNEDRLMPVQLRATISTTSSTITTTSDHARSRSTASISHYWRHDQHYDEGRDTTTRGDRELSAANSSSDITETSGISTTRHAINKVKGSSSTAGDDDEWQGRQNLVYDMARDAVPSKTVFTPLRGSRRT